jgi:DNA-binding MarR family transcriptional regulator
MQLLQKRSSIERQSGQLLGYLDALFRRLVLPRQASEDPGFDCSREEIRALILLRSRESVIMSDVAAELSVPLSTATHTVDRLVNKGLVVRTRSEKDRRVVQVELSDAGRSFQNALRARHQAMARSWLEPLSASERDSFLHLMAKITEGARPQPAQGTQSAVRRAAQRGEPLITGANH